MKFSTLWKFGAVAALLTIAGKVDSAWSATNCYDTLVGQTYRCKYKYEPFGAEFTDTCATFYARDIAAQKMYLIWSDVEYTCTCSAKGSYASPQYNQGKEFLCSSYNTLVYDAFSGKVVGNKLKGLYNSRTNHASAVVECTKDPLCP